MTFEIKIKRIQDLQSMKRLGIFLLPPRWDASPSGADVPLARSPAVFIYTPWWKEAL